MKMTTFVGYILVLFTFTYHHINGVMVDGPFFKDSIFPFCYEANDASSPKVPLNVYISQNNNRFRAREQLNKNDLFKNGPLSQSVETLISLIEKIEHKHPQLRADQLALILLKRYRYDELEWSHLHINFVQTPYFNTFEVIENAILKTMDINLDNIDYEQIDGALDPEENCTMHFLLSHTVDKSALKNEDPKHVFRVSTYVDNQNFQPKSKDSRRMRLDATSVNVSLTKRPREYGVGAFRNDENQAIRLNKLLYGVIAGYTHDDNNVKIEDVIKNLKAETKSSDVKSDETIDVLYGLTFTPLIIFATESDDKLFGGKGIWNSSICTNTYFLDVDQEKVVQTNSIVFGTAADIRGAIDAYNIGDILRKLDSNQNIKKEKLKLSQILRLYYSPNGFSSLIKGKHYCDRPYFNIDDRSLAEEALNYKKIIQFNSQNYFDTNRETITQIEGVISKSIQKFKSIFTEIKKLPSKDARWCEENKNDIAYDLPKCETPSDTIFMVDAYANQANDFELQMRLIKLISDRLNIDYGSSITILTNTMNKTTYQSSTLNAVAWNSTNRGCALCALSYANRADWNTYNKLEPYKLMENMNEILNTYTAAKAAEPGVPSKPFVFFNLGFLTDSSVNEWQKYYTARRHLYSTHREVPLIMLHKETDFSDIDRDDKIHLITDDNLYGETVKQIVDKICEVPATFQHVECRNRTSNNGITDSYTGYVSKGGVQYWAMYPEYYLKSYTITMTFKAETGKLLVCFSRRFRKPEQHRERYNLCKDIAEGDKATFQVQNPCEKENVTTCKPFYFSVTGDRGNEGLHVCQNRGCSNLEQIKFTFTHKGISCNSAFGSNLISLSNALLLSFIAIIFNKWNFS